MDAPLNSPYSAPPAHHQRVCCVVDPGDGATSSLYAYRVDYRVRVTHPDYTDPQTGLAWRFCVRVIGLGHIPAEKVVGWRELPACHTPDGYDQEAA